MEMIESVPIWLFKRFCVCYGDENDIASSPLPRLLASTGISWRQQNIVSFCYCAF